ncbi:MAG: ATP-binding protein, partial [Chthoniobacterales bacterium]|nr:ATP-binding protein [Chthoniobacterales bacterium]
MSDSEIPSELPNSKTTQLRKKAEQYLQSISHKRTNPEIADLASLVEELSIHQIELELQSEELEKISDELAKAKDIYYEFYHFAPLPIVRLDLEGKIIEGNLAACELLKHPLSPQQQNLTACFKLMLPREYTRRWSNFLKLIAESQEPHSVEIRLQRPINESLYFLVTGLRGKSGNILAFFYDIGKLRQREEELLIFRKAIEQSSVNVLLTDLDGNITYVNPAFESTSGYSIDEVIGQNPRLLKSGFHPPEFYAEMWSKLLANETWEGELQNKRKDGTFYWEKATISPVFSREQRKVGYLAIKHDITERKRFEEFLREMNAQLADANRQAQEMAMKANEANRAKSEFLANISHEIRTPMNGILGMLSLLMESGLNDEQLRFARIIRTSAESLLSILNDILDFSKIEARKIELDHVEFDIEDFLEDFALTSAVRARQKHLEFTLNYSQAVPKYVIGDPGRLRQILNNLISNAVKFTNHGSVGVRVGVFHKAPKDVLLEFAVTDTGIGIPPEKQEEIFEKFVQADATITRQYGGTGLGLAICKELVQRMGGAIRLRSHLGIGSEFSFTVKLGISRTSPPIPPIEGISERQFLIFESHRETAEVLQDALISLGAKNENIEFPDNLEDGLLWLQNLQPKGAIFLSYSYALQENGISILKEAFGRNVPAYVMTYPDQDLSSVRAIIDFPLKQLEKPILLRTVKELLDSSQSSQKFNEIEKPSEAIEKGDQQLTATKARILLAEDNFTNQQVALNMFQKIGLQTDAVANGKEVLAAL